MAPPLEFPIRWVESRVQEVAFLTISQVIADAADAGATFWEPRTLLHVYQWQFSQGSMGEFEPNLTG